ncbi:TPA: DNA N-6-adenine-methyltransferase [Vibrio cholerae]|uniref:DNA N-6-adenine-methyltransferase n=1 Tax=Vibrio cholerae TaxID=666 RepID=UPI001DBBEFC5|nr:hypothetical protein [Vibrio cholerae]EGR4280980.1 hypothetical protein [Vibrio cholerae]
MNIEIPDFLIEMSKQMHEQNNRITADPIWQVRHKQYLVTEQGYNESHWEIAATSEAWWPDDADFIQYIKGRVAFESPDWFIPATKEDNPSSAGFPSAVVIFDKTWCWEPRPKERLNRDDLIAQGNVILSMIDSQKEAA